MNDCIEKCATFSGTERASRASNLMMATPPSASSSPGPRIVHDGKHWFFLSPGAPPPVMLVVEGPYPETRKGDSVPPRHGVELDFSAPPAREGPLARH
jgi:hypothetical protein